MAPRNALGIALLFTLSLVMSAPATLSAGTKVKVKGDVQEVSEQVERAFTELEIEEAEQSVESNYAMAVGKTRSGSRLMVAVNRIDDDECELSVKSDAPADPDMEERFLRLMKSR